MENATKALIMAGAVLISILIISAGVFLWKQYSDFAKNNDDETVVRQLNEFNIKFRKYQIGTELTFHNVLTIVNQAIDFNKKMEESGENARIKVCIGSESNDWVKTYNLESNKDRVYKIMNATLYYTYAVYRVESIEDRNNDDMVDYILLKCVG